MLRFLCGDRAGEKEVPCLRCPGPDHMHSNDFNIVAWDSGKSIEVYHYNGNGFDGPRILCMHDGCIHRGFVQLHFR